MRLRFAVSSVLGALLALGYAPSICQAQLDNATVGRSGLFGNITRVGQLNSRLRGGARPSSGFGFASSAANQVSGRSAAIGAQFSGRSSGGSAIGNVRGLGTSPLTNARRGSAMMSFFGFSRSAQLFSNPVPTGLGRYQPPRAPEYSSRETSELVRATKILSRERSLEHAVYLPRLGGRIHDELTMTSLRNRPPLDEKIALPSEASTSPVDRLSARLSAAGARNLRQGWELLSSYDFVRSRSAFENAHMVDRAALSPRVGKFLCAVAGNQISMAAVDLKGILKSDSNPFGTDVKLSELFEQSAFREMLLTRFAALSANQKETTDAAAIYTYLLWLDGQKESALIAAEKLRDRERVGPYAGIFDKLKASLESTEADDDVFPPV